MHEHVNMHLCACDNSHLCYAVNLTLRMHEHTSMFIYVMHLDMPMTP